MPKKKANRAGRKSFYKVRAINFGWYRRKHDILLKNLPPGKQDLLLNNSYFRWMKGDAQLFEIIFRIEDMEDMAKTKTKTVWNPYQDQFTSLEEVYDDAQWVDWQCAICQTPIRSSNKNLSMSNFVCGECSEAHNETNDTVDSRIVESSMKFTKHCRLQLKYDQQRYYYYTEKQSRY